MYKELRTCEIRELLGCSESHASLVRNGHRNPSEPDKRRLRKAIDDQTIVPRIEEKVDTLAEKLDRYIKQNEERATALRNNNS